MKPFLLDDFKPGTNYVLEASAGTGKTYNIVEIVKKLVNEHGCKLDEILIVTYTDKAAGELKDRIRKGLHGQSVDGAPIYTIHSFCQDAIRTFGISAGLPMSLDVIDDEKLADFADRYLREGNILKDIVSILNVTDFKFGTMRDTLCNVLNKYYMSLAYEEDPSVIELQPLDDDLATLIPFLQDAENAKTIDELLMKYGDMQENYLIFKNSAEPKAQEFANELETKFRENFNFNGRSYSLKTRWSKDSVIDGELKTAFGFFHSLKERLKSFGKRAYEFLTIRYLKDFYQKWQIEKETNKEQTFNDMIRFVRESVLDDNSPMLANLRAKYKYAIIDEFQDTNQIQFDIFSRIFMCSGHNIIVVGDPKQSIYSFQGADVNVYHKAKKIIEKSGGAICSLNKNFRSTSKMVDSCNGLFRFYNFQQTDFEDCGSLSKGGGDKAEHDVRYCGQPIEAFWIDTEAAKEDEFAKIAVETIVDCCKDEGEGKTKLQVKDKEDKDFRNVSFKDFAVLARTRSEMVPIENALREVGVPFVRYKDKNLYLGKECADWIVLLTALNIPDFTGGNRKAFKKVLFTQFFGKSIKESADAKYSSDGNDEMFLVKKWKDIAEERRWEDLIDEIIVGSGLLERMTSLSQMQSLGIYKQIGNYCVEYLSNGHSLEELIKRLSSFAKGASDDDVQNGPIVERSTNFDAVQIMTIYASKGLQFPVVISVSGFKNPVSDGVAAYYISKDGKESHVLGFHSEENASLIENERNEEFKRLYYVGYTRAQFIMILPNYGGDFKIPFLAETLEKFIGTFPDEIRVLSDSRKDISVLKPEVKCILEKASVTSKIFNEEAEKAKQDERLQGLIRLVPQRSTYKHSYSSLSHSSDSLNEEAEERIEGLEKYDRMGIQIRVEMDENLNHDLLCSGYPRGARVGTALHAIFEQIDFTKCSSDARAITYQAFKEQHIHLNEANAEATISMINNVLAAELPVVEGPKAVEGASFSLTSISDADRRSEIEFNFNHEGELLKNFCNGFVDLLFKHDGRYCLLDWKSDSLNEDFLSYADNDELKKHVDSSYSIQRVLYSYCLIKWLKGFYSGLSEEQIFTSYWGGIYYIFLRGCASGKSNGVYCQTWASWEDLKKAYDYIMLDKFGGKRK